MNREKNQLSLQIKKKKETRQRIRKIIKSNKEKKKEKNV